MCKLVPRKMTTTIITKALESSSRNCSEKNDNHLHRNKTKTCACTYSWCTPRLSAYFQDSSLTTRQPANNIFFFASSRMFFLVMTSRTVPQQNPCTLRLPITTDNQLTRVKNGDLGHMSRRKMQGLACWREYWGHRTPLWPRLCSSRSCWGSLRSRPPE